MSSGHMRAKGAEEKENYMLLPEAMEDPSVYSANQGNVTTFSSMKYGLKLKRCKLNKERKTYFFLWGFDPPQFNGHPPLVKGLLCAASPDISAEKGIRDNSRVAISYSPFSKLAGLLIQKTSVHFHSPLHFLVQNLLGKGKKLMEVNGSHETNRMAIGQYIWYFGLLTYNVFTYYK